MWQSSAQDEELVLALLNSTPVVDGQPEDRLSAPGDAVAWFRNEADTVVDECEHAALLEARELLQAVTRGAQRPEDLGPLLAGVRSIPLISDAGVTWVLRSPDDRRTVARIVLAWGRLEEERPGRLRPCANPECQLFFVDRSRPGTGRWCSMAVCGNRMKARRHQARVQGPVHSG